MILLNKVSVFTPYENLATFGNIWQPKICKITKNINFIIYSITNRTIHMIRFVFF